MKNMQEIKTVKKLETLQDIKNAITAGKKVFCNSGNYEVVKDQKNEYYIQSGAYRIGLHGNKGTEFENVLNGKNFFTI